MRIIRNLLSYKATLPAAAVLAEHLAEKPFVPVLETHRSASGFINNPHTEKLVSPIAGGYSFRFRVDCKPLSIKAIKLAHSEQEKLCEEKLQRPHTKEESAALKDQIIADLIKATLPERTEIDAFYHIESRTLLMPTTSKDLAARVVGGLIEACGAVETSTIHVSDVKGGLTTRLRTYFAGGEEEAFDGFKIGDSVSMKGETGKASFDLGNLDNAKRGIVEALDARMQAERLALVHADAVSFKLTKDFHLRGIEVIGQQDEEEQNFETMAEHWTHNAGVQVLLLVAVIQALCDLFGYKEPVPGAAPAADPAAEQDGEADPLYAEGVAFVRETRKASISAMQRKLKIGYNRAARMIEDMEAAGVVTAMNSNGSREVID